MHPRVPAAPRLPILARLRRVLPAALVAVLAGCAIGTPLETRRLRAVAPPGPLQVSITHATLDPARRGEFDRWTRRVNDTLDAAPGLLAHSIRRELFGDQAWTFTVWASAADRERFVRSTAHRRAMDEASTGIASMRSVRLALAADLLPQDWDGVLALLESAASDGSARGYIPPSGATEVTPTAREAVKLAPRPTD